MNLSLNSISLLFGYIIFMDFITGTTLLEMGIVYLGQERIPRQDFGYGSFATWVALILFRFWLNLNISFL